LVIVGDGPLRGSLEDYVRRRKISAVFFSGFKPRDKVLEYYSLADVLVLPSSFEPHGLVVNEAMCFGLPVIVSDKVGAGPDLVKHKENGFIYPHGDTDKLALYLTELSNGEKRKRFGRKSRQIIENWDHSKAVQGLVRALDCICQE